MDIPIKRFPFPAMDRLSDQRDFVIKVKHGDTLRRIGAYVHGQVMDQNISKLREKIISLFKFNPDADFILTYTDEDGDLVTLDDDEELRDAVIKQQLNPLRINVELKSNTRSSTDVSSADETLKSVPLGSATSDLSGDGVKVVTSAPAFVQVADSFSKLDLSDVTQPFHGNTGESSGRSSGVSAKLVDCNVVGKPKYSGVQTQESRGTVSVGAAHKQHEHENENKAQGTDSASFDLNQDIPKNTSLFSDKEGGNASHDGKSDVTADPTSNLGESVQWIPIYDRHTGLKIGNRRRGALSSNVSPISPANWSSGTSFYPPLISDPPGLHLPPLPGPSTIFPTPYHPPPASQFVPGSCFVGPMDAFAKKFPPMSFASSGGFVPGNSHRGIRCNGCFMQPVVGPRFKSKVKDNYDLCSLCFSNSWMVINEADYTRTDLLFPPFKQLPSINSENRIGSSNFSWESSHKLQSCFIQDVTILDGTVMPPSTNFIKIWRMRNSGTLAWPFGSRLIYDGGDKFYTGEGYTNLEIPASGFLAGEELDIAVDLISPAKPGRYRSHWRLQTPYRQKFGPRVWVQIQVEESKPNTQAHPIPDFNETDLNESLVETGKSIDVNAERKSTCIELEPLELAANRSMHSQMNGHCPPHPSSSSADDVNEVEQILLKELEGMGFEQADVNKSVLRTNNYDLERSLDDLLGFAGWDPLLDELQAMGFPDEELNKKLLIKNSGSIKRAVMDLIAEEDKFADLIAEEEKFVDHLAEEEKFV